MRGRKPSPTALKRLRGNPGKRALPKSEPKPQAILPHVPRFLDKIAKAEWHRISRELFELGLLTRVDRNALAAYCDCFSLWKRACDEIAKEGAGLTVTGAQGQSIKNPVVTIREKALEQMKSYAIEFGMTPSSRGRLRVVPPEGPSLAEQLFELTGGGK